MSYLFKYLRHKSILKRLTADRLLNCLLLSLELKMRRQAVASYPIVARINSCPLCNLKCMACQVISSRCHSQATEAMTFGQYRQVLDKIAKNLLLVVLYDEGEPLLNQELPDIIGYTGSLNISTSVSTNLSMELSDQYLSALVTSGLDRITVSIDGATQETYQRYRAGGNLALVKDNLRRMLSIKREKNSYLFVEVQFLKLGFNDHEAPLVKKFAAEIGVNTFRSLPTSIYGLECYLANLGRSLKDREHLKLGCFDLWGIAHIDSRGTMFPCDFGEDNGMPSIGNLLRDDFRELWNSGYMRNMRANFARTSGHLGCATCRRCPSANRAPLFLR